MGKHTSEKKIFQMELKVQLLQSIMLYEVKMKQKIYKEKTYQDAKTHRNEENMKRNRKENPDC